MTYSDDAIFYAGGSLLALCLLAWIAAVWRGYSFSKRPLFRTIPFFLVIALFALAFHAERLV